MSLMQKLSSALREIYCYVILQFLNHAFTTCAYLHAFTAPLQVAVLCLNLLQEPGSRSNGRKTGEAILVGCEGFSKQSLIEGHLNSVFMSMSLLLRQWSFSMLLCRRKLDSFSSVVEYFLSCVVSVEVRRHWPSTFRFFTNE